MIVAHGTGPGHDLPVPLFYAVAGGALAVFLTFVAASLLYPESRLRGTAAGRAVPVAFERLVDAAATRWVVRGLALVLAAVVVGDAIRLPDDPHDNPAASVVYAVFWSGWSSHHCCSDRCGGCSIRCARCTCWVRVC